MSKKPPTEEAAPATSAPDATGRGGGGVGGGSETLSQTSVVHAEMGWSGDGSHEPGCTNSRERLCRTCSEAIAALTALGPPPLPAYSVRANPGVRVGEFVCRDDGVAGSGKAVAMEDDSGVAQMRQRLEAAERALALRDADVARLRQDKGRLEKEADDALRNVRELQVVLCVCSYVFLRVFLFVQADDAL